MQLFEGKIEERIANLKQIIKEKEKRLRDAPMGTVHIDKSCGRTQLKHYLNGQYRCLTKKDTPFVQKIFQKDYDEKTLKKATKELDILEKLLKKYPQVQYESIYEKLHSERKKLVEPIWLPDEEYIKRWENVEYEKKSFQEGGPEFYTNKGERVRSKSEILIANALQKHQVPYRYEAPLRLDPYGIIYPDFTALNVRLRKEFRWEHMGLLDEEGYREYALDRIILYEKNGYFPGSELILTHETSKNPINSKLLDKIIVNYLK